MDLKRLLLGVILFAVFSSLAYAEGYVNLEISAPRCENDGSFSFNAVNKFSGKLNLSDVIMTATHKTLGYSFTPDGTWSKDEIFYKTTHSKQAKFKSVRGQFKDEGNYILDLIYPDCKNPPCKEELVFWRCPGFPYNCGISNENLKITKCFPRGDKYYIYFEGLNKDQNDKVDVNTEIKYYINSNTRNVYNAKRLEGHTIEYRNEDSFIISFDLKEHEKIYEVAISVDRCDTNTIKNTFACREFKEEKEEIIYVDEIDEEKEFIAEEELQPTPENRTATMDIAKNKIRKDTDYSWIYLGLMGFIFALLIVILILVIIKQSR